MLSQSPRFVDILDCVSTSSRFLRHPITTVIRGEQCQLVTTGHLAAAIRRTPRTVRRWQEMRLLPPPPFFLDYSSSCNRRWLYPSEFIERLAEVFDSGVIGNRLDQQDFLVFRGHRR